jgi:serine/threonine protein phosphatase PrpC
MAALTYRFASAVDPGRLRANNEDAVVLDEGSGLAVLADGMGGYKAGEVASSMATHLVHGELSRWLAEDGAGASDAQLRRAMERAVDGANRQIFNAANLNPDYQGMGTTLVCAAFRDAAVMIGHVGDSRAYRLRQGRLARLTRDHSLLQEQIDAGLITAQEASVSTMKNLVTRAVGVEDTVLLETHLHALEPGDRVLLCSDGLSDMLPEPVVEQLLRADVEPEEMCRQLVVAANDAGGRDNISVVVVHADGARGAAAAPWWRLRRRR